MVASLSISLLSFLVSVAAQSGNTPADSTNPLIPSNVSPACQASLTSLNTDTTLQGCIQGILSTTSTFNNSAATPSGDDINNALDSLCSAQSACSAVSLRQVLTDFGVACANDFESTNIVPGLYDMLYALSPLLGAMCTKDSSTGAYCATQAGTTGNNTLDLSAYSARTLFGTGLSSLGANSLPFFFVAPDSGAGVLCSSCFRDVMQTYVNFEADTPYEDGVDESPLLQNQMVIWNAFQSACGAAAAGDVAVNAGAAPKVGAAPRRSSVHTAASAAAALLFAALVLF